MAENTRKDQSAIISLIVVIAAAAFFFGVYQQVGQLHKNRLTASTTEKQASALEAKIASLQSLAPQLSSQNSALSNLKVAFPASDKPEEIIIMLNSMATNSGVDITSIQPDPKKTNTASSIPAANISVTVSGDYISQVRFSKSLSTNIRPVLTNSVSLVGKPNSGIILGSYDLGFVTSNQIQEGQNNE